MKKGLLTVLLMTVLGCSLFAVGADQELRRSPRRRHVTRSVMSVSSANLYLYSKLDLTIEQKEKIATLRKELAEKIKAVVKESQEKTEAVLRLNKTPSFLN